MNNNEKIILDLCGGTGSWSKPYKDAGYDVRIITLPDYNVADCWITGDKLRFRKQVWKKDGGEYTDIELSKMYGVLAAPPCTMFSVARTTAKLPRDLIGAMRTVNACVEIIQKIQMHKTLSFWALENPRGHLRKFLGKPPFSFTHWQFEESIREKPTDIWGNFNIPVAKYKTRPTISPGERSRTWGNPGADKPIGYEHITERAALRAITPKGFAEAFYKANK